MLSSDTMTLGAYSRQLKLSVLLPRQTHSCRE